jgi:hypothetical protein
MIHVLLTRTPLYSQDCSCFLVRLACVKRAASVDSEPGSNSRLNRLEARHALNYEAAQPTDVLDHFGLELKLLTKLRPDIALRPRRCASST